MSLTMTASFLLDQDNLSIRKKRSADVHAEHIFQQMFADLPGTNIHKRKCRTNVK